MKKYMVELTDKQYERILALLKAVEWQIQFIPVKPDEEKKLMNKLGE